MKPVVQLLHHVVIDADELRELLQLEQSRVIGLPRFDLLRQLGTVPMAPLVL